MITKLHRHRVSFLPAILICLVVVNAHAAAHLGAGSVECEFCSTSHDPLDVIVTAEASCLLLPPTPKAIEQRIQQLRVAPFFSVRQRGPPSLIS
jgi:hypothetical protein